MHVLPSTIIVARLACYGIRNIGPQRASSFHTFSRCNTGTLTTFKARNFLKPASHTIVPANTLQSKWEVEKQCPYCYFVWRESRKFVYCKKHPSHNQQTQVPKDKERFIITHKTHGRKRPW